MYQRVGQLVWYVFRKNCSYCRYQAKFGAVSDLEPCYIVFGSVSSEDCDVMVRVPFDQLARVTNNMLVLNKELDALLGGVIGTDKVINSCFGYAMWIGLYSFEVCGVFLC